MRDYPNQFGQPDMTEYVGRTQAELVKLMRDYERQFAMCRDEAAFSRICWSYLASRGEVLKRTSKARARGE